MNIKKCPNCRGSVPEGNEVCNNCGHKVGFFGKKVKSSNSNTFQSSNSNGVAVAIIFIFIVFAFLGTFGTIFSSIYSEIFEPYQETEITFECSALCDGEYVSYEDKCMCSNGDIYNKYGEMEYSSTGVEMLDNTKKCSVFCDDLLAIYDGTSCSCSNGTFYDLNGNKINNDFNIESNQNDSILDQISQSIDEGKRVFVYATGIGSSNLDESQLRTMASKYENVVFYFIDSFYLSPVKLAVFTGKYMLPLYTDSYYFTAENGSIISNESRNFTIEEIETLISNFNN